MAMTMNEIYEEILRDGGRLHQEKLKILHQDFQKNCIQR